jgi:hypothetical protein
MLSGVVKIDLLRLVVAHCLKSFIFRVNVYERQGQSRKSETEINILKHAFIPKIVLFWECVLFSLHGLLPSFPKLLLPGTSCCIIVPKTL